MITPGTSFMYNLSIAIKRKIIEGGLNSVFKDKKVIFSDASIPGEGEHKLIHHIRNAQHAGCRVRKKSGGLGHQMCCHC